MGNEFQEALEHDNLAQARKNLNDFTGKLYKRRYEREIHMASNEMIDELQLGFINENPNLTFEELLLIKRFSDYMKGI